MGTLLDFASAPRPSARLKQPRDRRPPAGLANHGVVILFPGVRYERKDLDLAPRIGTIEAEADAAKMDRD